ncbi:sensor domain-containing diguanylate cyclase [Pseudoblastomonas halimionae]|uniref:diguanylate cyclase n=1 Tax=Alteriqipengyuania halimionae TaxID=1926630 RepID=A0A6I4U6Y6_9SPHN|nr:diguanylate cyclase [Alteriqipengyuania halimionae]MXP10633.1 diguanylate cyclase [Alteriqipengyuania halimionae]
MGAILGRIGMVLALVCACLAAPAAAATLDPSCVLSTSDDLSVENVRSDPRWVCDDSFALGSARFNWLRFDGTDRADYRFFAMEARAFDSIKVYRVARDGLIGSKALLPDDVHIDESNGVFVPLPDVGDPQGPVFVRIDGYAKFRDAPRVRLLESVEEFQQSVPKLVFAALLMGLVLAPCILATMLAYALRQAFVAWYALMCSGMALTIAMTSGLAISWLTWNLSVFLAFERLGYVLIVFASCQFARDFIEQEALSAGVRSALRWSGIAILVAGVLNALVVQNPVLFGSAQLVVLAVLIVAFGQALRRGSLWVRYQLAGWSFAMVLVADMALKGVGHGGFLDTDFFIVYYAMVWEILVVATGVTHRVLMLRSDRDRARQLAIEMETLAERDPLTGLLNRRAIDLRFGDLKAEGFTACALLDLDHFKSINDEFGHTTGDEVLVAVGAALAPDDDTVAIRVGGEEFMLLMRGDNIEERAKRRLAAISLRTARDVDLLDRIVTASMGLAQFSDAAAAECSLEDYYMRADVLLYRAKQAGRNKLVAAEVGMHDIGQTAELTKERHVA